MVMRLLARASVVASLGAILFSGYILTTPVKAAGETESITLSPVSKHYEFDAGAATKDTFKIINDGKMGYDFIVYARPYTIINSNYDEPNYGDEANKKANADAYKWVTFDQERYHLEPGESVDVSYSLSVPQNAAPGGHYGVMFAETQSATGEMIGRNKRVGSVVYATVNGDYTTGADIARPGANPFQIYPPLTGTVSVKNTGNASFVTNVTFNVFDVFGNKKYSFQGDYDIMPESTRAIKLEWQESPSFGLYKVQINAKALEKNVSTETYVLMAPFWFYGIVAILVVGGIMYAVARRKR